MYFPTHQKVTLSLLLVTCTASSLLAAPSWWTNWNLIDITLSAEDYEAINIGQLKHAASMAFNELEASLPQGAGPDVTSMVAGFSQEGNYEAVNVGQLKAVAEPFYDRLIAIGYADDYPWSVTSSDDEDYEMVNVGQLKNIFSFDITIDTDADGLYDWWEVLWFGDYSETSSGDADTDGFTNLEEFQAETRPDDPTETPTTIYVDPNSPEGGSGSIGAPYRYLDVAMAAVTPVLTNVFLFPGIYEGPRNRDLIITNPTLIQGMGGTKKKR